MNARNTETTAVRVIAVLYKIGAHVPVCAEILCRSAVPGGDSRYNTRRQCMCGGILRRSATTAVVVEYS